MKIRSLTLASLLLAACLQAAAQDNPYDIDNDCYKYFLQAESLVGKAGFYEANSNLLKTARAKGDTKSETLYYVEELKNLVRFPSSPDNDAKVDIAHKRLKQVATDMGYKQYYYYSYQLAQNYYYKNQKVYRTFALAEEMYNEAAKERDEYGIWTGDKFLASIYIDQDDFVSAKKYLLEAIEIYHETKDETIRRQSPTKLYCDLADTYPVGHDSVGFFVNQGYMRAKVHMDTLRCAFYRSKLAILEDDVPLIAGNASMMSGNRADAIKYYEKYLADAPAADNATQVAYVLGALYQENGDNAKALEFLNKALSDPKYGADAKKAIDALNKAAKTTKKRR